MAGAWREDAADGVQSHVTQARIAATGKQRLFILPERDVDVHTTAVVTIRRAWA